MHQQSQSCKKAATVADDVNESEQPKKQRKLSEENPFTSASTVEKLIVEFVVQDLQPLSIVEGPGFRHLKSGLNSKAKVMCTATLKDRLQTMFANMTDKV